MENSWVSKVEKRLKPNIKIKLISFLYMKGISTTILFLHVVKQIP
jgi:hypothetical protein